MSYDLPCFSNTQPLVGFDGTIYVATFLNWGDDTELEDVSSYVIALNPDGSEKWVKEFKAEEVDGLYKTYEFYYQMALSKSGVLVLYADSDYTYDCILIALDVNNNDDVLWEHSLTGDGYFPMYNEWSSPVIYSICRLLWKSTTKRMVV